MFKTKINKYIRWKWEIWEETHRYMWKWTD